MNWTIVNLNNNQKQLRKCALQNGQNGSCEILRILIKFEALRLLLYHKIKLDRSSDPEVLLGKGVLKKCSKFTGEHPCRSVISIKLESNFIEITLWHGCPPVNLLHIFRTSFPKNTLDSRF